MAGRASVQLSSSLFKMLRISPKFSQFSGLSSVASASKILATPHNSPNTFDTIQHQRRNYGTPGEAALADFLKGEIQAEKEIGRTPPTKKDGPLFAGFQVEDLEAEVKLTKKHGNETVVIYFNVNHSVDADPRSGPAEDGAPNSEEQAQPAIMISQPGFTVEIEKDGQKLGFDCQVAERVEEAEADEPVDLFQIDEIYIYSGELTDKTYATSSGVLDQLYDHLMGYLEERGIDAKFVDELVQYATEYEHTQYVNMLTKIKDFMSK